MILKTACYYFDDIINSIFINFSDTSLDKKLYKNISVYEISGKISTVPKLLHISSNKIDGFIMVLDGKIKHLVLFDYGLFDKICNNIKYYLRKKSGITNSINHNLEESELIHIILYLFRKCWLSILW